MRILVGVALVLTSVGCKREPRPERPLEAIVRAGPASAAGDAIAWITEDGVTLRRHGAETHVSLTQADCHSGGETLLRDVSFVYLYPDARHALIYGSRSNMDFDLFGHAGRRLGTSCFVDFERGTATTIEASIVGSDLLRETKFIEPSALASGSRLYLWANERPVELIDVARREHTTLLGTPSTPTSCRVHDDAGIATIACVSLGSSAASSSIEVRTFDVSSWPPAPKSTASYPFLVTSMRDPFVLSPDGRRAALVDQSSTAPDPSQIRHRTTLVSLADGHASLLDDRTYAGSIVSLAFDPLGRGIWVGERLDGRVPGRVRLLNTNGETLSERLLEDTPYGLVPIPSGQEAWSLPPVWGARRISLRLP